MMPSTTAITFTRVPARSSQTHLRAGNTERVGDHVEIGWIIEDAKLPIGLVHPRHHPRTRERIAFKSQLNEGGGERMKETHGSPRQHAR